MIIRRSTKISYGSQCPMMGSVQSAWKSCPKAFTSVATREKKPTATNQCATPTTPPVHPGVAEELPTALDGAAQIQSSVRVPAGTSWPSRTNR